MVGSRGGTTKGPVQGYFSPTYERPKLEETGGALDGYEHVLRAHEEVITDEDEDFPMDDGIKIHEGAAAIRASCRSSRRRKVYCNVYWNWDMANPLFHADGFVARDPSLSRVVAPWQAEAASLGRWDKIPQSDISDSRVAPAATVAAFEV